MADFINTHYVKRGFATSDDVELSSTKTTRVIFRPAMHKGGVRGYIIRQKIGKDGKWQDLNEVNFNRLDADSGVSVELDTQATTKLYDKLVHLYQVQKKGVGFGDQSYVVAKKDEVLLTDDADKAKAIQELLDGDYPAEFWKQLSRKNPDLAARLAAAEIQVNRQAKIAEFEESLTSQADNEKYWQKFFEENPWMLQSAFSAAVFMLCGEAYVGGKLPPGRQGEGGVATDFLFADESTKSFAVIEIKTPSTRLVGGIYRGEQGTGQDNETYSMHSELSGAIVQTRNEVTTAVEHFESVIGKGFQRKINRVHPKGVLIVGQLSGLTPRQQASFNQFRHGQYSLTIITFDELLKRLKILYDMDVDETPASPSTAPPQTEVVEEEAIVVEEIGDEPINLDDIPF